MSDICVLFAPFLKCSIDKKSLTWRNEVVNGTCLWSAVVRDGMPQLRVAMSFEEMNHGSNKQKYLEESGDSASLTSMLCIQRLVPKMDDILTAISCPICFEVPDVAIQCTNGHLLCLACRRRSIKCPICRTPLRTPTGIPLGGRNLLAEQLRSALLGSVTSHEAETTPKPVTETKDEPPSPQKQKKTVIQQFTSHLFHRNTSLKGLQRHIGAMTGILGE